MKYLNNHKGMSLVELIAALALVSLVSLLIMTTLSIGIKRSIIENDKVRIQQEANIIVSKLLNNHRNGEKYCLKLFESGGVTNLSYGETCDDISTKLFNDTVYKISSATIDVEGTPAIDIPNLSSPIREIEVEPETQNVDINIEIVYVNADKTPSYEIDTTLSRYKTN